MRYLKTDDHYDILTSQTTDDKPSDQMLTVDAMKKLGSIRIRFFRGKKIKRNKPGCSSGIVDPPLDEVPEKLLKGKGIKNNVK